MCCPPLPTSMPCTTWNTCMRSAASSGVMENGSSPRRRKVTGSKKWAERVGDRHECADLVAYLAQPLGGANARVVLVDPEDHDVSQIGRDFHARVEIDPGFGHGLAVLVPVVALPRLGRARSD